MAEPAAARTARTDFMVRCARWAGGVKEWWVSVDGNGVVVGRQTRCWLDGVVITSSHSAISETGLFSPSFLNPIGH
jgi:hypothetical protein